MTAEQVFREIVRQKEMQISRISRKTGISHWKLRAVMQGERELKADEWVALCVYFDIDPRDALRPADKKENPA